jgi:hypothetical protein
MCIRSVRDLLVEVFRSRVNKIFPVRLTCFPPHTSREHLELTCTLLHLYACVSHCMLPNLRIDHCTSLPWSRELCRMSNACTALGNPEMMDVENRSRSQREKKSIALTGSPAASDVDGSTRLALTVSYEALDSMQVISRTFPDRKAKFDRVRDSLVNGAASSIRLFTDHTYSRQSIQLFSIRGEEWIRGHCLLV